MSEVALSATARSYPKLPYSEMKDDILGKEYRLSLVFIGKDKAQKLNKQYRKKTYVPNVLSFPLSDKDGEIFITPVVAKVECKKYGLSFKGYIGFLYIHALLHLKGLSHGATMDKAEAKYTQKYGLE